MTLIKKIESLLLKEFKTVPFHNLFMLNNLNMTASSLGGTCSDKVLHFRQILSDNGIKTNLHSAFINGKDCHRMLSILIENKKYYIDVGSGWPSIKIFPAFDKIEYSVFGMSFKTELLETKMLVHHKTNKNYNLMLTIPLIDKDEVEVINRINHRFEDKSIYPFHNSLRFSIIVGDSFYFLKGNYLRTYNDKSYIEKKLDSSEIFDLITNTFKFDLSNLELRCIDV